VSLPNTGDVIIFKLRNKVDIPVRPRISHFQNGVGPTLVLRQRNARPRLHLRLRLHATQILDDFVSDHTEQPPVAVLVLHLLQRDRFDTSKRR
jgi:hypothetical protein